MKAALQTLLLRWQRVAGRRTRGSLLAERDFRLMWISSSITSFGAQISLLALPLTAVVILNATPTQMGLLTALESIPFALFSLQVGVLVDRVRKLPILLFCEAFIALVLALVPIAQFAGWLSMSVLYVVGFLLGVVYVVAGTTAQVFLTHLAGRKRLIEANSMFTASDSAARLTGPGIAGALIQFMTAPYAIVLDCFGFVLSFIALAHIHAHEDRPVVMVRRSVWRDIAEGLLLVWRHPVLRTLTYCALVWFFLFQGFLALETLFASRELGLSAGQIGLAHMLGGAGALAAALSARHITRRLGMGTPILLGMLCSGLSWVAISLIGRSRHAFEILGGALFMFDFGVTLYWIHFSSLRQSVTPDALLGRMTATMRFFTVALAPVGAFVAGALGERIGLRPTLALAGGGVITLALTAWFLSRLRTVPDLSRPEVRRQWSAAPLNEAKGSAS